MLYPFKKIKDDAFFESAVSNAKNILIIKLTMIGDTLLLYPSISAIRDKFPESSITMLCSEVNRNIVEEWNVINNIDIFDLNGLIRHPLKLISFIVYLRKKKYDLVIDFEQWFRITPLIAYFSNAPLTIGFETSGQFRHYLFTKSVIHSKQKHEMECFLDIVTALGISVKDRSLRLGVKSSNAEEIEKLLRQNGIKENDRFIVIHPGCGIHGYHRMWQEEKYAAVADYIIEKYAVKIVITGGKDDSAITKRVIGLMKNKAVDFSAKTNLKELFAVLQKSLFVICGNTGLLHMAAAIGKKTIAIHGPTDPNKWGPIGTGHIIIRENLSCSPCSYLGYEFNCNEKKCTKLISTEAVTKAVDIMFHRQGS